MEAEVFVATRNLQVFEGLDRLGVNYQAGLFTDELCAALQTARKVIVDQDDLVPLKYSVTAAMGMISQQGVEAWSSERFLQDPNEFLKLISAGSSSPIPPKRVIAFTSYSGGTGKTTLALDTALRFARAIQRASERPVLLIEFTFGVSALAALTGLQMPSLFDLVTADVNELEPARYNGVTLIPMEYETARDLSLDLVREFLKKQMSDHILTIVDAQWPHGLLPAVQDFVDRWLIVATPRVDAVANADKLRSELKDRAFVALNQRSGLVDNLALSGFQKDLDLPRVGRPEAFEGKQLGEAILQWLYGKPAWAKYSQPAPWWSTLFRNRRR